MDDFDQEFEQQQEYNDYIMSVNTLDGWPPMDPPEVHEDNYWPEFDPDEAERGDDCDD